MATGCTAEHTIRLAGTRNGGDAPVERKGLVSIIIPVYNSSERLEACLDSIVAQTYETIEVLIVDDCSTDGSLEICRAYEARYPYVHVFTKANEGVSAARNYGMSKAAGEYIQFADSDDQLKPDACRQLVYRMEQDNSDLVIGGYYNEKEQRDNTYPDTVFESRDAFIKEFPELFTGLFLHVPWNKLYRRRALTAKFPENLSKGEDLLFNLQVFSQVSKISMLSQSVYEYHNVSDSSLSFRFREDAMEIEERLYLATEKFYVENGGSNPLFLDQFYLDAVKSKFYALLGKSGFGRKKCCAVIRDWLQKDSIRQLYIKRKLFGNKDRILLFLMYHQWDSILYLYYQRMAK